MIHPLAPVNLYNQIPKKSDQRQMEAWQRIGTYAAGLALDSAGIKDDRKILARTDMIVAAGGGARDLDVDAAILTARADATSGALNERLMNDLRPTLADAMLDNAALTCWERSGDPRGEAEARSDRKSEGRGRSTSMVRTLYSSSRSYLICKALRHDFIWAHIQMDNHPANAAAQIVIRPIATATVPTTNWRARFTQVSMRAEITSGIAITDDNAPMPNIDPTPNNKM
jgi:hypothetical protein